MTTTRTVSVTVHQTGDHFTATAVDTDPQAAPHASDDSVYAVASSHDPVTAATSAIQCALNDLGIKS